MMEQIIIDSESGKERPNPADTENVRLTGDPFVDMGALVMATLPEMTIEDKIRFATDVYVDRWKAKLHAVFLHSKMTHISLSNKPKAQRSGSLSYYLGLLNDKDKATEGFCRICAESGPLFNAERSNFPMVGSGEFTNFHHLHEPSLLLCKACLIRLYFLPLGLVKGGGNLMMLQVQNEYAREFWEKEVILQNLDKISRGSSEGILNSRYTHPQNALFHLASGLILRFNLYESPAQRIRLFCFSNFGATPDVTIHDMPNTVFSFLQRAMKPDLRSDWTYFIRKFYRFKKTGFQFDSSTGDWYEIKKKDTIRLEGEEYEGYRTNAVYDRLLSGKSILGLLRAVHRLRTFSIHISIAYLKEVRKMRQEQIDTIKKISQKIIALAEKTGGNYKHYMTPIEGARYAYQLRGSLIRMAKAHLKNNEKEPFIRFDDYVEYLFPDGQSWYETRDMLLICLYEKLHELNVDPEKISDQPIAEIEETETSSMESQF
jgi:CRISPR-associated protein Cst1